jgi:hypothetical protein
MNVVGSLIWYDESPSWLANCVSGFARVCDTIVAVDGAYALYPGARPRSHPDQAYAIQDACETMGIGCVIHRPRDVWWGNEVEKRQQTIELARPLKPDWLLVFDADYLVMLCEDPVFARSVLEQTDKNVCTYTLLDGKDVMADEYMAKYAEERAIDSEWTIRDRGIFRWTDDLRYGPTHYCVRGTYGGEEQWLRGPDLSPVGMHRAAETEHMGRQIVALHRRQKRSKMRSNMADGYYKLRDSQGAEAINEETLYGERSVA